MGDWDSVFQKSVYPHGKAKSVSKCYSRTLSNGIIVQCFIISINKAIWYKSVIFSYFFFYETDVFLDFLPLNVQESVLTFRESRFTVIKRVLT